MSSWTIILKLEHEYAYIVGQKIIAISFARIIDQLNGFGPGYFWKVEVLYKLLPGGTVGNAGLSLRHRYKLDMLENKYADIIAQYTDASPEKGPIPQDAPYWVFWLQGEEAMPPITKACLRSIRRNAGTHPVILLTKDNMSEYAEIPGYIMDKIGTSQITYTHFSDILRSELITEHGGIWIDSTVYLNSPIPAGDLPFFSIRRQIHRKERFVSLQKWTGFLHGGVKGVMVDRFIRDFLFAYHKKEKALIDYFLIDYALMAGYEKIPAIREMLDALPFTCPDVGYANTHLEEPVDMAGLTAAQKENFAFKMKWRRSCDNPSSLYMYLIGT